MEQQQEPPPPPHAQPPQGRPHEPHHHHHHHHRAPPPAYAQHQHEPAAFHLPSVPTHLPHHARGHGHGRLPGIEALDLPATLARHAPRHELDLSPRPQQAGAHGGRLPSPTSASHPPLPGADDTASPMDTASVDGGVCLDDPDVRLAAEALSGLGNPAFARSPPPPSTALSARAPPAAPEPLLSLITSNHPWLGHGINGSISAYHTTKGYTPRFVQYGAELLERNIASPVVNTVSSVGRRTGMEQNLRRYLGEAHRRPSDLEQGDADRARTKRQRVASPAQDAMDVDDAPAASRTRGASHSSYTESLPAYDDHRSPNYEEAAMSPSSKAPGHSNTPQHRHVNWSTQLIMTTSGLGVALSETSLRSLRLCLGLLRRATTHIDAVMRALHLVLEEYEAALRKQRTPTHPSPHDEKAKLSGTMAGLGLADPTTKDAQVGQIAHRIKALSADIWKTLQSVVSSVSRYTGGALPENASRVVRTQLLSVPQRWQLAGRRALPDVEGGEEARGANRMLAFAKEGLDMMGQITTVVDGTVQSAEGWLARIGRAPVGGSEDEGEGEGGTWSAETKSSTREEQGVGTKR